MSAIQIYTKSLRFWIAICALLFCRNAATLGDEIILNESTPTIVSGDFSCSTIPSATTKAFPISPRSGTITTGELWTFFKEQGISRLDTLVLCVDVPPANSQGFDLDSIELKIRQAGDPDAILKQFSLDKGGDNSLFLPSYQASDYRPEVQLSFQLGYNFMEKFTAESDEEIVLNAKSSPFSGGTPKFYLTGKTNWLSGFNSALLVAFTVFWLLVFIVLFRVTNPNRTNKAQSGVKHNRQSVLSV